MSELAPIIVLPYRYGDCVNVLPLVHSWSKLYGPIPWVVHEEFIDLFDGVSYVQVLPYGGRMNDLRAATLIAEQYANDLGTPHRLCVLKSGSFAPNLPRPTTHFSAELWERAGELDRYHQLPLVFDQRHREREAALVEHVLNGDSRPVLGHCFKGHSFKFNDGQRLTDWLIAANEAHGNPYQLLNLNDIRAYRLFDMLAVLERCTALFSIDTSLVHLAKATNTPTAVITQERDYDSPEPQRHWIHRLRGSDTNNTESMARVAEALFDEPTKRLGRLCRSQERMYASVIMFALVDEPGNLDVEVQLAARESYRIASTRDRFWNELDILLPLGQLGATRTLQLVRTLGSQLCKYVLLARPGTKLQPGASHEARRLLDMGARCVVDATPQGAIAASFEWLSQRLQTTPSWTWTALYNACRGDGVCASHPLTAV